MKFNHKTTTCFILVILAAVTLTSCKPKSYGNFKVIQSKAVKGDYIILPDLTVKDDEIAINPDKSYHFPLIMYKAIENRLSEIATKINDFSTGISETEAEKLYGLYFDDHGAGLISDEKQKLAYYAIITDLTTKQDAKNAEATALFNEMITFSDMFSSVIDTYLSALTDIYDFVNKNDTYTISHEELFTIDLNLASTVMSYWFPSVKFISSFEEKTGPYIENPWIPDWEKLISLMTELNNNYANALISVDSSDPDEIEALSDYYYELYCELEDDWYDLPSINEYEDQFDALTDHFFVIDDKADDMWDKAYDAYWNSYWDYYWY